MRILVVDDEVMILKLAEKILTRAGHEVLMCESGKQGIETYAKTRDDIDLILLDLRLQDMSGISVLEQVRAINPSLPCILSSGDYSDEDVIPEKLKPGTCILEKPYRVTALIETIEQICTETDSTGEPVSTIIRS